MNQLEFSVVIKETPVDPLELPEPVVQRRGMCGMYKLSRLKECPVPGKVLDMPERAAEFWEVNIKNIEWLSDEVECFVVLFVNTRRYVTGFQLVSTGTLDTLLVHPREVFRTAIVCGAAAIIVMHNHPSGDPTPSEADIKITRDLIKSGMLLKIELLDHIVIGKASAERSKSYVSLRELGYFYQ